MTTPTKILVERLETIKKLFPESLQADLDFKCEDTLQYVIYRFGFACKNHEALLSLLYVYGDCCDAFPCLSSSMALYYEPLDDAYGMELSFRLDYNLKTCVAFLDIQLPQILRMMNEPSITGYRALNKMPQLAFLRFESYIRIHIKAKMQSSPKNYMRILATLIVNNLARRMHLLEEMTIELTSTREIFFHLWGKSRDWNTFFLKDPFFQEKPYTDVVEGPLHSLNDLRGVN